MRKLDNYSGTWLPTKFTLLTLQAYPRKVSKVLYLANYAIGEQKWISLPVPDFTLLTLHTLSVR